MFHEVKPKIHKKRSINKQSKAVNASQSKRFSNLLLQLSKDITPNDKLRFIKKHGISKATISRYLNGNVSNNDTALKMITFFKSQIDKRKTVAQ